MTVSPNRSQDGDRPNSAAQAATDDRLVSPALPPTLFALPNLNAPVDTTAEEEAVKSESTSAAIPPTVPVDTESTTATDAPLSPAPVSEGQSVSETLRGTPAGRGWMEKIGAHTLVLLMLVILVAAAWVTGKKQGDALPSDSVVADLVEDGTNIDLGDIDSGIPAVELPIPAHLSTAELDPPSTSSVEAASTSDSQADDSRVAFDATSGVDASPASTRNYTEAAKPPVDSVPLEAEPAVLASEPGESLADSIPQNESSDRAETGPRLSKTPAWINFSQYLPEAPKNETSTDSDADTTVDAETVPSP